MSGEASEGGGRALVAVEVVVSGRVQGVFFRDSCSRLARSLGVSGWVRNTREGNVHARFEGAQGEVARLVEWCRHGPPQALVTGVEVRERAVEGVAGFRVR